MPSASSSERYGARRAFDRTAFGISLGGALVLGGTAAIAVLGRDLSPVGSLAYERWQTTAMIAYAPALALSASSIVFGFKLSLEPEHLLTFEQADRMARDRD